MELKMLTWLFKVVMVTLLFVAAASTNEQKNEKDSSKSCKSGSNGFLGSADEDCGCASGLNRKQEDRNRREVSEVTPLVEKIIEAMKTGRLDRNQFEETPLVTIPGGEFTMGTDDPKIPPDGEAPARKVKISEFKLQKFEVSNRQFAEFVLETGFVTDAEKFGWSFCFEGTLSDEVMKTIDKQVAAVPWWVPVQGANWWHPNGIDGDVASLDLLDHPVVHISHNDARAYCKWLGMRLPREAEFERSSRGGLENEMYPWGSELYPNGTHRANLWQGDFPTTNTMDDGFKWASPVNSFGPQNEYGVYNIIGNAWEWVADAWTIRHHIKDRNGNILENPQVEMSYETMDDPTMERVKKGGSYMCHISYCYRYRTASRSSNTADSSAQNLGLRCAKDLEEEEKEEKK